MPIISSMSTGNISGFTRQRSDVIPSSLFAATMKSKNLYQILEHAAIQAPEKGLIFHVPGHVDLIGEHISYSYLLEKTRFNAGTIHHVGGIHPASIVLLHFNCHWDSIEWFWAVVAAGYIPAISTPFTNDDEQRKRHLVHLKTLLKNPVILTTTDLVHEFRGVENLNIHTIESLQSSLTNFDDADCNEYEGHSNGGINGNIAIGEDDISKCSGVTGIRDINGINGINGINCLNSHNDNHTNHNCSTGINGFTDLGDLNDLNDLNDNYTDHNSATGINGNTGINGTSSVASLTGLVEEDEIAALMLTSGSTGQAKAVCLRYNQILASVQGKIAFHGTTRDDVFLNWVGLDHVANLTEIHLHAMLLGADQVHVQATDLLPDPLAYLALIDKHRVAFSFSPNFFLASVRKELERPQPFDSKPGKAPDFSCLRALTSGGEANVVETCSALTKLMQNYGSPDKFITPGFGMTETCAGAIYNNECPNYDIMNKLEFASLGNCIPGLNMRVTSGDEDGRLAGTNEIGNLELSGPIVFTEYFNNLIATAQAFTSDGWFSTGDRALLDSSGRLILAGRLKESIIINGVKYYPQGLESAIEEAKIEGIAPSYTAVFPHRPKGAQSEVLCVVYLPTFKMVDMAARSEVSEAIAKISLIQCGTRPYQIIPLEKDLLPKSSLGKLSRAKIRIAFENGAYDQYIDFNTALIQAYRSRQRQSPSTKTESVVLAAFSTFFDIPEQEIGINANIYEMGASSIDIIRFKKSLQIALSLQVEIPVITMMTNPTIKDLAKAIDNLCGAQPDVYSPAILVQRQGSKTPLWLVHPGVGEILVFLNLAKTITDRPLYALRARGFEGQEFFKDISEVVSTYHEAIKKAQRHGPYAIAGYSFGSMIAFEITKVLEANGDTVLFLGSFNLPPHIKFRMRQLDWTECILNLAYFLDLIGEAYAHEISPAMHLLERREEVLDHIIEHGVPNRLLELALDRQKLMRWADLAYNMQAIARDYDPSSKVTRMDVFYANPLSAVAKSKTEWMSNHLSKWTDFVAELQFHEVGGSHYTMLSPEHILSFSKQLKAVLQERGV